MKDPALLIGVVGTGVTVADLNSLLSTATGLLTVVYLIVKVLKERPKKSSREK